MKFELRDYQHRVVRQFYQLVANLVKSVLIYAPTGAGKTAIACKIIADAIARGQRVLFLIHRDELVEQTQEELAIYGIRAGVIKAGYKQESDFPVQIASLQTLQKREFPPGFNLIVIDEAHTTAYWSVFKEIKKFYSPSGIPALGKVIYLGLSATPWRLSKNEFMGQHFEALVKAPSILELVEQGYLVYPVHKGWGGVADMSKLELSKGPAKDFTVRSMKAAVANPNFNSFIVNKFKEHCDGRTAIAFCVSVKHSQKLAEDLNAAGIPAVHIDADTMTTVRKHHYDQLRRGEIRVICSINTLTEGFNIKSISAVILARPTNSVALLRQMVGRGLRQSPQTNKHDCILLDFCENFNRHRRLEVNIPVKLCPDEKEIAKSPNDSPANPYKECPQCSNLLPKRVYLCAECGYAFPVTENPFVLPQSEDVPDFGELLSRDEYVKAIHYRRRLRECFEKWQSPANVTADFFDQFGHLPPENWRKGALFKGENTEENQIEYANYLATIRPEATEIWIMHEFYSEFGKQGSDSGDPNQPKSINPLENTWYTILGLDRETCTATDIYEKCQEKLKEYAGKTDPKSRKERILLIQADAYARGVLELGVTASGREAA